MMSTPLRTALNPILLALVLTSPFAAQAHFQELIPSAASLDESTGKRLTLDLRFTHPMERGPVMDMGEPLQLGVQGPGGREDLKPLLAPVEVEGQRTYRLDYEVKQPGDYVFYIEPAPYWEPAEGIMIQHYTKVVVDGFGAEEGWDADLGLPVEIAPLARPYGLWTGNLFTGIVKRAGRPVPFTPVEIEWRNDGSLTPPRGPYVTQVVKTDAQGVFSYAMPKAGWWGFAALMDGERPMRNPDGEDVPVELGALIWVFVRDLP
jgi:cobalt/nickel transport protein